MNELLAWMSAKHSGSLAMLRGRTSELWPATRPLSGVPQHREAMWNLSKLGHAEFGAAAEPLYWRVAPPVLAMPGEGLALCGIVCGARLPSLLTRLRNAFGSENVCEDQQDAAPDRILVRSETHQELKRGVSLAGLTLQKDAPAAMLAAVAPGSSIEFEEVTMPVGMGWNVQRFSKSRLGWVGSDVAEAGSWRDGLFRFRGDYQTIYILREDGTSFSCPPAVGKFRVLKRKNRACFFDVDAGAAMFPVSCRPPELIERALVLCSGKLPKIADGFIAYGFVSRRIAAAVASLLGQNLNPWNAI